MSQAAAEANYDAYAAAMKALLNAARAARLPMEEVISHLHLMWDESA